jgi:hypothetical protein
VPDREGINRPHHKLSFSLVKLKPTNTTKIIFLTFSLQIVCSFQQDVKGINCAISSLTADLVKLVDIFSDNLVMEMLAVSHEN